MKTCTKCHEQKESTEFHVCRKHPDGLTYTCKECSREYNKQHYSENRERIKNRTKEYYASHLEQERISRQKYHLANREEQNKKSKKYYEDHKKELIESAKTYHAAHPEIVKISQKNFKINHPERVRFFKKRWAETHLDKSIQYTENRRARKEKNGGTVSKEEWEAVKEKYGNRCLCCGKTDIKLHMDHVKPLTMGGSHSIENIQPLCKSCNSSKHTKYIDYREGIYAP